MTLREGYEMYYFGSTEYQRINNQSTVQYISTANGRNSIKQ